MKTLLTLGLTLAAATLASTPTAASAQEPVGARQLVVSYADLDLRTERGQRVLDRRLRAAVEIACGPVSSADPEGKNDVRTCRATSLADARAQRDIAIAARPSDRRIQVAARR